MSNSTYIVDSVQVGNQDTGVITYALTYSTFTPPITSTVNDTPANWASFGNLCCFYKTAGQLIDQPSQYGILLSMFGEGNNVSQLWFTQASGKIYRRSGNSSKWASSWKEILQEGTTVPIESGGTGATSSASARTNLGLGSVSVENVLPVAKGGTNATDISTARTNLGLGAVSVESIVPISKGGTNATDITTARTNLQVDKAVAYTTFSGTQLSAASGTEYTNSTAINSLSITLPTAARGVIFGVNFTSSDSFTGVTFSASVKNAGEGLTMTSRRYNMIVWYDGSEWWCAAKGIA